MLAPWFIVLLFPTFLCLFYTIVFKVVMEAFADLEEKYLMGRYPLLPPGRVKGSCDASVHSPRLATLMPVHEL